MALKGLNKMNEKQPKTLYHYCSLPTFYNIIKNKSIWLSDVEKSNDFLELVSMRQLFAKEMDEQIAKKALTYSESFDYKHMMKLNDLQIKAHGEIRKAIAKHLFFCLSEKGDLLSQWRGYADDGSGISIGFNRNFLCKLNDLNTQTPPNKREYFQFEKVDYNEDLAVEFIKSKTGIGFFSLYDNEEEQTNCIKHALAKVALAAPFHKTAAFIEECEWRIVVTYMLWSFEKPDFSPYNNNDFVFSNIEYTASKNKLVPHLEIKFPSIKNAISEIVIGPKCDENIIDMKYFLVCMGVLDNFDDNSITIKKSTASYR